MKKNLLKKLFVIVTCLMLIVPSTVNQIFAAGVTASTTSVTLTVGRSTTVRIGANDAAGKVTFTSSNTSVATVNTSTAWADSQGAAVNLTIKAVGEGSCVITVYYKDVAQYSNGADLSGKSFNINVTVKPAEPEKSADTSLDSIGVEEYTLNKVSDDEYTLTVPNSTENVTVYAKAHDPKATVSGTGKQSLAVGVNVLPVVITAENGSKRTVNVKVTRKDGIYVEDIPGEIARGNNGFTVIEANDTQIPGSSVEQIKGATTNLVVKDFNNDGTVNSYVKVNGTGLGSTDPINLVVDTTTTKDVVKASNYLVGTSVNYGPIAQGTTLGINVSDIVENGEIVNVYRYNAEDGSLELVLADVLVDGGFAELEGIDATNLYVTPGTYVSTVDAPTSSFHTCIWFYIAIISILVNLLQLALKGKKRNRD